MTVEFSHTPSEKAIEQINQLYANCAIVSVEQHPEWYSMVYPHRTFNYAIARDDDKILCSAIIEETQKLGIKSANILFGPIFTEITALTDFIERIYTHYKQSGFTVLNIQLNIPTSQHTDQIEYDLYRSIPFKQHFNRENWSSIAVDLTQSEEALLKNMSKGHKSDIKKAVKSSLTVIDQATPDQFNDFMRIYAQMESARGLRVTDPDYLSNLKRFIDETGLGNILLVLNGSQQVIGGIIVVHQHKTGRYLKGAANPEIRNLPVLHIAIWEAMRLLKGKGFEEFDLWGYNHFVSQGDQVFNINRFKKGFGGTFTFYPKKLYYILSPAKYMALNTAKRIYKKIK